jgi:hypothetical protein
MAAQGHSRRFHDVRDRSGRATATVMMRHHERQGEVIGRLQVQYRFSEGDWSLLRWIVANIAHSRRVVVRKPTVAAIISHAVSIVVILVASDDFPQVHPRSPPFLDLGIPRWVRLVAYVGRKSERPHSSE